MDEQEIAIYEGLGKLPRFRAKVEKAKEVIKESLSLCDKAFVAVSWGKDSLVLLHLCQQVKPDILAVNYGSPEQEIVDNYREIITQYCERYNPHYKELIGLKEWADTPDTVKDRNFQLVGGEYQLTFVGLRAEESRNRKQTLLKNGLIYQYQSGKYKGTIRSCPLGFWSSQDIWTYIISNNLPYLQSYETKSRETGRTNAHARYWYRANKDTRMGQDAIAYIKRHNHPLYSLLQEEGIL